jgi:hypothetical protein
MKRLALLGGVGLGGLVAKQYGTDFVRDERHHPIIAWATGREHIGMGIYLDMKRVLAHLTPEELKLLDDPKTNRDPIIRLFGSKLLGGYDYSRIPKGKLGGKGTGENVTELSSDYPWGIDASHFFNQGVAQRGVCRHKAIILTAVLNKLGIEARNVGLMVKARPGDAPNEMRGHAVVYLPETQQIVDPTNGYFDSLQNYTRELVESYFDRDLDLQAKGLTTAIK